VNSFPELHSKYQRVGSCLLLLRANPYFRALDVHATNNISTRCSDMVVGVQATTNGCTDVVVDVQATNNISYQQDALMWW
jgi:hypothetical protein